MADSRVAVGVGGSVLLGFAELAGAADPAGRSSRAGVGLDGGPAGPTPATDGPAAGGGVASGPRPSDFSGAPEGSPLFESSTGALVPGAGTISDAATALSS